MKKVINQYSKTIRTALLEPKYVLDHREKIENRVEDLELFKSELYLSNTKNIILQEYYEAPYLSKGFKIDLRTILLIKNKGKKIEFFSSFGFLKRASYKFNIGKDRLDIYSNISNSGNQKLAPNYDKIKNKIKIDYQGEFREIVIQENGEEFYNENISNFEDEITKIHKQISEVIKEGLVIDEFDRFQMLFVDILFDEKLQNLKIVKVKPFVHDNVSMRLKKILKPTIFEVVEMMIDNKDFKDFGGDIMKEEERHFKLIK